MQNLSLSEISAQLNVLKEKAHNAQLQPDDLSDTSITLSNVGVIGGRYATPIVNSPQLAICALGRMRKGFVFNTDDQAEVWLCGSVLTCNNFAIHDFDREIAVELLGRSYTQNPTATLIH